MDFFVDDIWDNILNCIGLCVNGNNKFFGRDLVGGKEDWFVFRVGDCVIVEYFFGFFN